MQDISISASQTLPGGLFPGAALPRAVRRLTQVRPEFRFLDARAAERASAEESIAKCFERTYGATISSFMPLLLTMKCSGRLSSIAGVRPAETGTLFLENYLDQPVETMLTDRTGARVYREQIFELGNLAATRPGVCFLLYIVLANVMYRAGFDYAVFTATRQVARIIDKLNFCVMEIGEANPERLGSAASSWGTYYDSNPKVMAVDVRSTMQVFRGQPLQAVASELFKAETDFLVRELNALSGKSADRGNLIRGAV